jgi:hypothetical protein
VAGACQESLTGGSLQTQPGDNIEEHQSILASERNPEWHAFYELLWHLGGSQTDVATLQAENIDWSTKTTSEYALSTGEEAAAIACVQVRGADGRARPGAVTWTTTSSVPRSMPF